MMEIRFVYFLLIRRVSKKKITNWLFKQAKKLFLEGIALEKLGKAFEAMRLYSRAVHIDPDIEFKIYEASKRAQENNNIEPNGNCGNTNEYGFSECIVR